VHGWPWCSCSTGTHHGVPRHLQPRALLMSIDHQIVVDGIIIMDEARDRFGLDSFGY
jgi:hypothetical protein